MTDVMGFIEGDCLKDVKRDWKRINLDNLPEIVRMTGEWRREKGFESGWSNFSEKLMLVITEGDEAMEALDGMRDALYVIARPNLSVIGNACQKLIHYLDNYVEEWVDVMVRVFDVIDACHLEVDEIKCYGDFSPIPHAELVSSRGMIRFTLLCRALSRAMECFRDVTFEANGFVPEDNPENNERVEDIGHWLSNAALVAAHAIEDVGMGWHEPYADKMIANERRPTRHGRQR